MKMSASNTNAQGNVENRPPNDNRNNNNGRKQSRPSARYHHRPRGRTRPKASHSAELEAVVQSLACYGDEQDNQARLVALDHLEVILARWTQMASSVPRTIDASSSSSSTTATAVSSSNNNNNNKINPWQRPRVALVSFGSFRLGVHRTSSDLDVLVLGPPSSTRDDFFQALVQLLRSDPKVSDVHPIPGAYTPVIKFTLQGFQVDMLFARLASPPRIVPLAVNAASGVRSTKMTRSRERVEYTISDTDLVNVDEAGVRSINGARVSQILLQDVPDLDNFRCVLKAVKEWAEQAGIYSNVLGFLGGVNWAILVAWVCTKHPASCKAALLEIFFRTFAQWKWPRPVLLRPIQDEPPKGVVPLPAWNPETNPRDGLHIMPIITPAYPSMNSSYNVGMPQLRRIQDEMILACNHLSVNPGDYASLFQESNFFFRHEHFVQVTIRASNRQDFVEWFRLVESRLRLLITSLETPQVHAWPFARFFDRQYDADGTYLGPGKTQDTNALHESLFFIALRFEHGLESINLQDYTSDFLHKVNSWESRKAGMDLSLTHVTSADLPDFVLSSSHTHDATKNNTAGPTKDFLQFKEGNGRGDGDDADDISSSTPATATTANEDDDDESSQSSSLGVSAAFAELASPTKKCRTTA